MASSTYLSSVGCGESVSTRGRSWLHPQCLGSWSWSLFLPPVALLEARSSGILYRRQLGVDLLLADPPGLEPLPASTFTRRARPDPSQPSPRPVLGVEHGAWGHAWWFCPFSCRSAGEESLSWSWWKGEEGAQIRSGGIESFNFMAAVTIYSDRRPVNYFPSKLYIYGRPVKKVIAWLKFLAK